MKNAHRYIRSKATTNVYMQLYGGTTSGKKKLLRQLKADEMECDNKEHEKKPNDDQTKPENQTQNKLCVYQNFVVTRFGCHAWLSSSFYEPVKEGVHAVCIVLDASEPNDWCQCEPILNASTVPVCLIMNKRDRAYRRALTKSYVIGVLQRYHDQHRFDIEFLSSKDLKSNIESVFHKFFERIVSR